MRKCPMCRGYGYILRPKRPGEKHTYGDGTEELTLIDCPTCSAGKQQEYLEHLCRLSPEMRDWTFDATTRTKANLDAYQYLLELATDPHWFVTLQGAFGVGKTRLLACLVNAGRQYGWTSIYLTMAELLDYLRSAFNPKTNERVTFDGMWENILEARILAIDECDRWNPTPWAQEKFFELVEARYRNGAERCTAFATNAEIETLDGYLASRMRDRRGRVFQIAGGDWRQ